MNNSGNNMIQHWSSGKEFSINVSADEKGACDLIGFMNGQVEKLEKPHITIHRIGFSDLIEKQERKIELIRELIFKGMSYEMDPEDVLKKLDAILDPYIKSVEPE